jgi:hypothetical protein
VERQRCLRVASAVAAPSRAPANAGSLMPAVHGLRQLGWRSSATG